MKTAEEIFANLEVLEFHTRLRDRVKELEVE